VKQSCCLVCLDTKHNFLGPTRRKRKKNKKKKERKKERRKEREPVFIVSLCLVWSLV
jgi:hypothetical protein